MVVKVSFPMQMTIRAFPRIVVFSKEFVSLFRNGFTTNRLLTMRDFVGVIAANRVMFKQNP